jgi:UDP-N-acetylglucosamine pyrophosphorylase
MLLNSSNTIVIVGWQKRSIIDHLARTHKSVTCVAQEPQLGTGHAVMQAEPALHEFTGDVLVLSGDVPLLSYATMKALIDHHQSTAAAATVLTAELKDPSGYGRIVRNAQGRVLAIVEQKDATDDQRKVKEINSGIYVFDKVRLFEGLKHITPSNAQKEYYLTDVFAYFWNNKLPVQAVVAADPREIQGINTLAQLEEARAVMGGRG